MKNATIIPEDLMEGLTIRTSYDKITFDIRNHHYLIRPRQIHIRGFKPVGHFRITYPLHFRHQGWDVDVFVNIENHNNIIFLQNDELLRISFNPEGERFTGREIESVLNLLREQYTEGFGGITDIEDPSLVFIPQPLLHEVEIAIDFIGGSTYFLLEELGKFTHKKRARKRTSFGGGGTDYHEVKGVGLSDALSTHYLGGKRSSHSCRRYLRIEEGIEEPIVRFELILRDAYLRSHRIDRLRHLQGFDAAEYWKQNYNFFDIDYKHIQKAIMRLHNNNDPIERVLGIGYWFGLVNSNSPSIVLDLFRKTTDSRRKKLFPNPSRIRKPVMQELHDAIREALDALRI